MTSNEAIQTLCLMQSQHNHIRRNDAEWEAVELAKDALRAQLAAQSNDPLTLEELRGMLHKPVYDGLCYDWYIIDEVDDGGITMADGTRFDVDNGYDAVSNRFYRRPNHWRDLHL